MSGSTQGGARAAALTLALAFACAQPAAVAAAQDVLDTLSPDQRAQYAFEAPIVGSGHALEHVLGPEVTRQGPVPAGEAPPSGAQPGTGVAFDACLPRGPAAVYEPSRPIPPKSQPTGQARCSKLPVQPRAAARLARVGRWTDEIVDLPHYAIHAALLTSGKIMFWGFEWTQRLITRNPDSHQNTSSEATLYNPARSGGTTMRAVLPPMIDVDGDGLPEHVPLYCSGQTILPDGRVLVVGGTLDLRWAEHGYTQPPGLKVALIFDPKTETWSRAPDMTVARWYPTAVELADGRTVILGGFDDAKPTALTATLDVASPDASAIVHAATGDRETWTYPGLLLLPDATVLLAGPRTQDTGLLDPRTLTWTGIPPLPQTRGGENLVQVPTRDGSSPQAMILGGADFLAQLHQPHTPAYRTTLSFDMRTPAAGFVAAPSLNTPRNWPNTVLLPDGSMVIVGGGDAISQRDGGYSASDADRHVELWDPATKRWRVGPAQREARTYHSVALLLPDGRVWSAGDDANPNRDGDTAEFYEPPYLFRGTRPQILAAPRRLHARRAFTLTVRGAVAERVTMLAPGAVTHARDMHQRFVELEVLSRRTAGDRTVLRVAGPRSSAAAPPGPWMLFALSAPGAPSVARWTRVS